MSYPFYSTNSTVSPEYVSAIADLFNATSVAVISLTVANFFAAILTIVLIVSDNRRIHNTWVVSPSRRIPLSIAIAIGVSHLIFILKAFDGLSVLGSTTLPRLKTLTCKILNKLGFWAIWTPLLTIVIRVLVSVAGISFHFNAYVLWMEWVEIFLTAIISVIVYIPAQVLPSTRFCIPFVLIFFKDDQSQAQLATAGTVTICILLLLLIMGLLVIGYDTALLKRERVISQSGAHEIHSADYYIQAQQKRNPDRKLLYYAVGLFLQNTLLLPNFVLGAMGTIEVPLLLLASVALHLDGFVLLFQYLFGHRNEGVPRPNGTGFSSPICYQPPYTSTASRFGRRSEIDTRSYITTTISENFRELEHKDKKDDEKHDSRILAWSTTFSPVEDAEIASSIPLPKFPIQIARVRSNSISQSFSEISSPGSLLPTQPSSVYRSLWEKAREAVEMSNSVSAGDPALPTPRSHLSSRSSVRSPLPTRTVGLPMAPHSVPPKTGESFSRFSRGFPRSSKSNYPTATEIPLPVTPTYNRVKPFEHHNDETSHSFDQANVTVKRTATVKGMGDDNGLQSKKENESYVSKALVPRKAGMI